ncbi:MAG: hypothetical protein HQ473_07635 [Cryomorphaceae bacterium]|nr:hypothetical protein [Cryomorphaceae bacterium]
MALQVYNPSHPDKDAEGWVLLTADAAIPTGIGPRIVKFRDPAVAITGVTPNGVAESGVISLPGSPHGAALAHQALVGVVAADGTITALTGEMAWYPWSDEETPTADAPVPATSSTSGLQWGTIIGGVSTFASFVGGIPQSFFFSMSGIAGTATELELRVEVHLF